MERPENAIMDIMRRNETENLRKFLDVAREFRLGDLPTEQPHPSTRNLSALARENPVEALRIFHELDSHALEVVADGLPLLQRLAERIGSTLSSGGSVYLTGCGSTGRLSLACESIWRKERAGTTLEGRVKAFMAGGDIAMVRSVESFEDHPEYGARQLEESGFKEGDLLIASTEGGETPFVIGAALRAAELSAPPWFLYCNPDGVLSRLAARSAAILRDGRIEKLCLPTGPMALSGSTRLQASTVLMAAVGGALSAQEDPASLPAWLAELSAFWRGLETSFLAAFVEKEARIYGEGGHLRYVSDPDLSMTVLTDTTERAPTFSMHPFANDREASGPPSACSLLIPSAADRESAWTLLLGRPPVGLEWEGLGRIASREKLMGFDFSSSQAGSRETDASGNGFILKLAQGTLVLELGSAYARIPTGGLPALSVHIILKMLLNAHSTLVMGRLGRFDGNLMSWVKPSNHKLVDRAIRYADILLKEKGVTRTYEELAEALFELKGAIPEDRPLVFAMVDRLSART
jgi:N-acetylmuramic acid 6-phosphate etherase